MISRSDGFAYTLHFNAKTSSLQGFKRPDQYIATKGPTEATLVNFWRMLWKEHVDLIVMVTNEMKGPKKICHRYWPESYVGMYDDIRVQMEKEDILVDFTLRSFSVEKDGRRREIKHFQYTSWSDKDVPETCTSLLNFRRRIQRVQKTGSRPVVVHCSTGVGRTGMYIAIDYLLEQAEAEGSVDVVACVNRMRENRMGMVQNAAQYSFIYTAVAEELLVGNVSIPCSGIARSMERLGRVQLASQMSGYEEQFKLLDIFPSDSVKLNFNIARLPKNHLKNRDLTIVPVDEKRLFLRRHPGLSSDYINAVFVDGYRSSREFIVTQTPLSSTRVDIWQLVEDFDISTIVMLNEIDAEGEETYYPKRNESLTIEPFSVTCLVEETASNSLCRRKLQLKTPKANLAVTHLSIVDWPNTRPLLLGLSKLIRIFHEVKTLKQKQKGKGPVLVHCLNGATRSGLFCAMYMMLEKINAEKEVDVFNSVKKIRSDRPQFVRPVEQYVFLHQAAQQYIDSFKLYANCK